MTKYEIDFFVDGEIGKLIRGNTWNMCVFECVRCAKINWQKVKKSLKKNQKWARGCKSKTTTQTIDRWIEVYRSIEYLGSSVFISNWILFNFDKRTLWTIISCSPLFSISHLSLWINFNIWFKFCHHFCVCTQWIIENKVEIFGLSYRLHPFVFLHLLQYC